MDNNNNIGFHEPSIENIYDPNYYYKPYSVGYTIRPMGGLHPIYYYHHTTNNNDINIDDSVVTTTMLLWK